MATGWEWTPLAPGDERPRMAPAKAAYRASRDAAARLASALNEVLLDVVSLESELTRQAAELAAAVPVVSDPEEQRHLAERLEATLRGAAQSIGADAAALYLLDEATTSLKTRSAWGLPSERLLEPPRRLQGALGDLEALTGHAVVLEHAVLFDAWRCPEYEFGSAICVPVAHSTSPVGTLWVFCREERPYSDEAAQAVEIAAGRIAAELERHALLVDRDQRAGALQSGAEAPPRAAAPAPELDCFTVAAHHGGEGSFVDWFEADEWFRLACGSVDGPHRAAEAAAAAAAFRTAGQRAEDVESAARSASKTCWAQSPGANGVSAWFAELDEKLHRVRFCCAGEVSLARYYAAEDRWEMWSTKSPPCGASRSPAWTLEEVVLAPGDVIAAACGAAAVGGAVQCVAEEALHRALQGARSNVHSAAAALAVARK